MYFYSSKQFRFLKLKKRLMPKLCNQQQQNLVFLRKKWRELSKQVWRKMSTEWWESLILMKSSRNHKISLKIQNRRIRKSSENNSLKKSPYNIRGMLQRVMVIHVKEEIQLQGLALTLLKQTYLMGHLTQVKGWVLNSTSLATMGSRIQYLSQINHRRTSKHPFIIKTSTAHN